MPRRAIPLVAGQYYHVYNRGSNRQDIFFERENYLFFLRCVRKYLLNESQAKTEMGTQTSEVLETSEVYASIVAYCLMPNHYHLLVCPHDDSLSRRMQRFSISSTPKLSTGVATALVRSSKGSSRHCLLIATNTFSICPAICT